MRSSATDSGTTAEHTAAVGGRSRRAASAPSGARRTATTDRPRPMPTARPLDPAVGRLPHSQCRRKGRLADMRGTDALAKGVVAACVVLAVAPAANAATCPHDRDLQTALPLQDTRAALLCVIDAERTARGLPTVRQNGQLARAAQGHAADMVAKRFFAHVAPDGATLADRVAATGYMRHRTNWALGEAIAWAEQPLDTAASLVQAWLASPPHRAILLDRRYREVGIGVAAGLTDGSGRAGTTAVLDFGFRTTLARWRSAKSCARAARRSRQRPARCASTSKRSKTSPPASRRSSIRGATT